MLLDGALRKGWTGTRTYVRCRGEERPPQAALADFLFSRRGGGEVLRRPCENRLRK